MSAQLERYWHLAVHALAAAALWGAFGAGYFQPSDSLSLPVSEAPLRVCESTTSMACLLSHPNASMPSELPP